MAVMFRSLLTALMIVVSNEQEPVSVSLRADKSIMGLSSSAWHRSAQKHKVNQPPEDTLGGEGMEGDVNGKEHIWTGICLSLPRLQT